eukprot:scaffold2281_cov125-Isochrysis_galbana.AAC.5
MCVNRAASAGGDRTAQVAVLFIHMERKAVTSMNPSSSWRGWVPKSRSVDSAMRSCARTASSAAAITRPPKNRTFWPGGKALGSPGCGTLAQAGRRPGVRTHRVLEIVDGHLGGRHDAEQREQHERKQRGDRNRQHLKRPVNTHDRDAVCGTPDGRLAGLNEKAGQQEQRHEHQQPGADHCAAPQEVKRMAHRPHRRGQLPMRRDGLGRAVLDLW